MRVGDNKNLAETISAESRVDPLRRMKLVDESGIEFVIASHEVENEDGEFIIHIEQSE